MRAAPSSTISIVPGIPGIQGVDCHPAAASGWMAVVSLRQMYPCHVSQALAITAQCPTASYYTKWIIAVDDDVDPTNFDEVIWALSTRCNPSDDLDILRKTMSFRADPSLAPEVETIRIEGADRRLRPYRYLNQSPRRTFLRRSIYDRVFRNDGRNSNCRAPRQRSPNCMTIGPNDGQVVVRSATHCVHVSAAHQDDGISIV